MQRSFEYGPITEADLVPYAALLDQERPQDVLRQDFLLPMLPRQPLRILQRLLRLHRKPV